MKPGRKSVKNTLDRLLYPEKYLKKTELPIGKKRNCCLYRFEKRKKESVHPLYVNTVILPFVLTMLGKLSYKESFVITVHLISQGLTNYFWR